MEIKLKTTIKRASNRFIINVPKTYVDDGNLNLEQEYEVILRPMWEIGLEPLSDTLGVRATTV